MASTETIKFLLDIDTKTNKLQSVISDAEDDIKKFQSRIEKSLRIDLEFGINSDKALSKATKALKTLNKKVSKDLSQLSNELKISVDTSGLEKLDQLYSKLSKKKKQYDKAAGNAPKQDKIAVEMGDIKDDIAQITSGIEDAREKLLKQAEIEIKLKIDAEFKGKLAKDVFGAIKGGIGKFASKDLFGAIATTGGGLGKAGLAHLEHKEKKAGGSGLKAAKFGMYMGGAAGVIGALIGLLSAADTQFKEFSKSAVEAGGGLQFLKDTSGATAGGMSSNSKDIFDGLEKYNDAIVKFDFNRMWRVDPKQHMEFLNAIQGANVSVKDLQNIAGETFTSFENDLMKNAVMLHLNLGVPLSEIGDALGTWVTNLGMSLDDVKMSMAALSQDALSSGMQTKRFFDIVKNTTKGMGLYGIKVEETSSLLKELSMALGPDEAERAMAGIASFYHNESMQGSIRALAIGGRRGTKAVEGSVNRSVDRAIGDGDTTTKENRSERIKTLKGIRDALIPKMQKKTATVEEQGKYRQATAALSQATQFGKGGIMNAAMALPATDLQGKLETKMAEIGRMTGIYDIGDMDKMTSRSKLAAEGAGVMNDEQFRQLSALGSYVKDIGGGSLEKAIATMSDEQKKALMGTMAGPAKETAENTTTMADALSQVIPAILNQISGGIYDIVDYFANSRMFGGTNKDKLTSQYRKEEKAVKADLKNEQRKKEKMLEVGDKEGAEKQDGAIAYQKKRLKEVRDKSETLNAITGNSVAEDASIEVMQTYVNTLMDAKAKQEFEIENKKAEKDKAEKDKARKEKEATITKLPPKERQKAQEKLAQEDANAKKEEETRVTELNKKYGHRFDKGSEPVLTQNEPVIPLPGVLTEDPLKNVVETISEGNKLYAEMDEKMKGTEDILKRVESGGSLNTLGELGKDTVKGLGDDISNKVNKGNILNSLADSSLTPDQLAEVSEYVGGSGEISSATKLAMNADPGQANRLKLLTMHDAKITRGGLAQIMPGEIYKPAQAEQMKTGALANNGGGSGANITINIHGGDINAVKQTVLGILYDHDRRRATA